MQTETYIVKRNNNDEVTFAAITINVLVDSDIRDIVHLKRVIREAVTDWARTTPEGRTEWEQSGEDFNIGDLANAEPGQINDRLMKHRIQILSINTFSMEGSGEGWAFDDALVDDTDILNEPISTGGNATPNER